MAWQKARPWGPTPPFWLAYGSLSPDLALILTSGQGPVPLWCGEWRVPGAHLCHAAQSHHERAGVCVCVLETRVRVGGTGATTSAAQPRESP